MFFYPVTCGRVAQIRSTKSETRNKHEFQNPNEQNGSDYVRIGFRILIFEFLIWAARPLHWGLFYVFIESIFIIAIGAKMKTGSHDQNCGNIRPNTGSVDNSLQMKMVMKQTPTIEKLAMMADFISLGSRQTRTGKQSISITKLMIGSVAWKCICEDNWARSLVWTFCDANCCNYSQLSIDLLRALRRIGMSLAVRSLL